MEPNIAVLIDFENIAAGCEKEGLGKVKIDLIMNRLREKGRVLVVRSYADWGRFARFKKDLLFEGVSLFELSAHGMNDKNRADVALVVDCMELALSRDYIDTYVIVSGDSDFTPLILKLRELNKRVLGLGTRRSTSRLIIEACDEFIFYDTLHKQKIQRARKRSDENTDALSREEAMELVTEALVALNREDSGPVHASRIKETILRKEKTFSEQDLGFSSLGRFLEYCKKQGIVRLEKDPKGGGYMVFAPDGEEVSSTPSAPVVEHEGEAKRLYELLTGEEMEPLSPELRDRLAEAIVKEVAFRTQKKKRINLNWVTQDVTKRLRQADSRLSKRHVSDLINVLHNAGAFVHSDGEPVRSFFAQFELRTDAAGLRMQLDAALARKLGELGVDLAKSTGELASLLYGDAGAARRVEEMLAWELTSAPAREVEEAPSEASPEPEPAPKPAAEKPKRRRSPRKKKEEPKDDATDEAKAEAVPADEPSKVEAAPSEPDAAPAEAPTEEAPAKAKPKRRRTPRKKKEEPAAEASEEAKPEKPKRVRTARRKKKEPEATPEATPEAPPAEASGDEG